MNSPQDETAARLTGRKLRFGAFEVDLDQQELRHKGLRVHLQRKPFQLLELLLQRRGSVVTRTELAEHLWPGLHVSFGRGLNTAINVLRQALGDSSAACRYIETRSGLGYRFVATVEELREDDTGSARDGHALPGSRSAWQADSYWDYRKARYLQNKLTEADLVKSAAHFEAAIRHDPSCAPAHAGLADTYALLAFAGLHSISLARARSKELIGAALQLDNDLAEAHVSLAGSKSIFLWNYAAAEKTYRRALELDPGSLEGHRAYASFLSAMGRPGEALRQIQTALEADSLSLALTYEAARISYMARRFDDCIRQAWQMLVLEPEFGPAQYLLGLAYEQAGLIEDCLTELHNAKTRLRDDPAVIAALGHCYARAGMTDRARAVLGELGEVSQRRSVSPYWRSIVCTGLDMTDTAFRELEAAAQQRDVWLIWLRVEPRFDPLRADPRFADVLASAGFTNGTA